MSKFIEVSSQSELEKVCAAGDIAVVRSGNFRACDSSQVRACDSSQVRACDSSQVTAYGYSQVRACGSSQVRACDSSQVRACDSSQVRACDSSQVTACGSSQVTASKQVAVTIHGTPKVKGGKQIKYRQPQTTVEWLANYGVKVSKGVATLYKAVRDDYKSSHGTSYAPGTTPKADDWDNGKAECGGGLHFCPFPWMALSFDSQATKYVACPIKVSEIVVHKNALYSNKVKAPRVYKPTWECDINGNAVEKK